jgi:hypothetical protein
MQDRSMAEPLAEKDFQKFIDHLKRKVKGGAVPPCPICGTNGWGASGPEGLVRFEKTEPRAVAHGAFPVVTLICKNCFFTHLFAWIPIEQEAKKNV